MDDNQEEVEKHFNYLMFSFPVYTSGLQTNRMDTFYTFHIVFKDHVFPDPALHPEESQKVGLLNTNTRCFQTPGTFS